MGPQRQSPQSANNGQNLLAASTTESLLAEGTVAVAASSIACSEWDCPPVTPVGDAARADHAETPSPEEGLSPPPKGRRRKGPSQTEASAQGCSKEGVEGRVEPQSPRSPGSYHPWGTPSTPSRQKA